MSELAALEPLRAALLAGANADADRIRAAAEQDGQETIAGARKQADALLADARAQGETEGAALLAVDRARARRTARSVVLAAQRAAYDELHRQACDAVRRLLDDPARQACLAAVVRSTLGEDAVIREQPRGGLRAGTPDGRSIDASVEALVDTALADLDLEQLWTAG